MLNNSIMNNLIDEHCNLVRLKSIEPCNYFKETYLSVFDSDGILDLNEYLDFKSVVVFGMLIRKDWLFTVPACWRRRDQSEPRFVRLFRNNLGRVLRNFFLRVDDIDYLIRSYDCFLSGSVVLKALMGTECSGVDWHPNDLDIYCQWKDGLGLKNRLVMLYRSKSVVDSVDVLDTDDFGGYHMYSIIIRYSVVFDRERIIKFIKVQVISCEGQYAICRYDFQLLQNTFGVKRNSVKSIQHDFVIHFNGDVPYQRYDFVSGNRLLPNEEIVENEITDWGLSIGCVDSLRFRKITINPVLFTWLNDTTNLRTVCSNIKSLKVSLNFRLTKYLQRCFHDRDNLVSNTLRCLLYRLYMKLRLRMETVDVSEVHQIPLVEVLAFIGAVDVELPIFYHAFDDLMTQPIRYQSVVWEIII